MILPEMARNCDASLFYDRFFANDFFVLAFRFRWLRPLCRIIGILVIDLRKRNSIINERTSRIKTLLTSSSDHSLTAALLFGALPSSSFSAGGSSRRLLEASTNFSMIIRSLQVFSCSTISSGRCKCETLNRHCLSSGPVYDLRHLIKCLAKLRVKIFDWKTLFVVLIWAHLDAGMQWNFW